MADEATALDLYAEWLNVSPGERPPDHYALLGVERFSTNLDEIEKATRQRMDSLDRYALHPDTAKRDACQRMMNEVAQARMCLVHVDRRAKYNTALADRLGIEAPQEAFDLGLMAEAASGPAAADRKPAFEAKIRAHLLRWMLNPHEELLLVAEAAEYGFDPAAARQLIHQIDRECATVVAASSKRWTWIVAGGLAAALLIVFLSIWMPYRNKAQRHEEFLGHLAAARQGVDGKEFGPAIRELRLAGKLEPDNPLPRQLRDELVEALLAATEEQLQANNLAEANESAGLLGELASGHPKAEPLTQRVVEALRIQAEEDKLLAAVEEDVRAGNYADARRCVEQAVQTGVSAVKAEKTLQPAYDNLLAEIRSRLAGQEWMAAGAAAMKAAQLRPGDGAADRLLDQACAELVQKARAAADAGRFPEALRSIDSAIQLKPNDPKVRSASREISAKLS